MMSAPQSDQPTPYRTAAQLYRDAGWPAPLPVIGKYPPPTGWTGTDGEWPSGADIQAWTEDRGGDNIGLRLPRNVLGIDVDNYGDKRGAATLAECEERWGPLPVTWRSTSRDDGISGIRLVRIPEGRQWPGQLPGGGVELIQWSHRYVMCWPSIHPKTGGTYRWTRDGVTSLSIPSPAELPMLPVDWIIGLVKGPEKHDTKAADIASGATWVAGLPGARDEPCDVMARALKRALGELRASSSRHDDCTALQLDLVRLAEAGHPGGIAVLTKLGEVFVGLVGDERQHGVAEARSEYLRALDGASAIVAAQPSWPPGTRDPCTIPMVERKADMPLLPQQFDSALLVAAEAPPGAEKTDWGQPLDIAAALQGKLRAEPPTELARTDGALLLYPGKVNGLLGPSESGKTWIALHAAAQAMNAGRNVLMLDFEDTIIGLVGRLRSLGVADDTILAHMTYIAPAQALTPTALAELQAVITDLAPALIILDGVNAAMTVMGLDLVSNKDATFFHIALLKPMSQSGAAVVVIDHTPKNDPDGTSKGAIGAQAKRAAMTGAAIKVEMMKYFSRTHAGILKLTVDKDRGGHVRMATTSAGLIGLAHIEPGEDGALSIRIDPEDEPVNEDGEFRPTVLMDRVAEYLTEHPGANVRAIMSEHFGRDKYVRQAIDALVKDGYVGRTEGPNRAQLHSMIRVWPGSVAPVWPPPATPGVNGGAARVGDVVPTRRAALPLSGRTDRWDAPEDQVFDFEDGGPDDE